MSETPEKFIVGDALLILSDCIAAMRAMPANSVDSIVTDPPYHLTQTSRGSHAPTDAPGTPQSRARIGDKGFMGNTWDGGDIAQRVELWAEALRVLKPGGHLLAFSGSRTSHRMVCAIEDAGFEIRDSIPWIYGSGFPKSLNVSKAIDKAAGATREVIAEGRAVKRMIPGADQNDTGSWIKDNGREFVPTVTAAATDAARQWEGWGTALKPAHEPICLARKPLVGTVIANVLAHGTGALNIDACRVEAPEGSVVRMAHYETKADRGYDGGIKGGSRIEPQTLGRWPANIIHDGSDEVLAAFPDAKGAQGAVTGDEPSTSTRNNLGLYGERAAAVPRIESDTSAARFFYCAKASRGDRHAGLDNPGPQFKRGVTLQQVERAADVGALAGNTHPTVKPTDLMRYLARLVTPPGGVVLDPFMGSGSTGKAAMLEGFRFIGIDITAEYVQIARARIGHAYDTATAEAARATAYAAKATAVQPAQLSLID